MAPPLDLERLRQTLGRPELHWLVERARRRLERGERLDGAVILRSPTPGERSAFDRLLGRSPSLGDALRVELSTVAEVLRNAEIADTLEAAVEALTGPLVDQRARREAIEESWRALFREARARIGSRAALVPWVDEMQGSGLVRRLAGGGLERAKELLDGAAAVLERLPAAGVPLAELAATATGDSHALDADAPLSTVVLRAVAAMAGTAPGAAAATAEARRDAWAAVGVLCDELSAPVLGLNLRPAAGDASLTARALRLHCEEGEPYRITVRQLLRHPPHFDAAVLPLVYVCENPTVVAAAANRLGNRSAPILAIEGQPKTAARLLLQKLAGSGTRLLYHGDFDWAGLRIGNLLIARHATEPWRFSTQDYLAAKGGRILEGSPIAATWDPELEAAMARAGRAIHEEQVLQELLSDLEDGG